MQEPDPKTPRNPDHPGPRGRPVGVKNGMGKFGQGHRILRGTQALALKVEIQRMHQEEKSIAEICSALKLAKGVALTSLFGNTARRQINQLIEESTIDCMVGFGELMETLRSEMLQNKVKSALGVLNWTPEQIGTAVRAAEKYMEILKESSGHSLRQFKEQMEEKKDPRMLEAQQIMERLQREAQEAKGVVLDAESTTVL